MIVNIVVYYFIFIVDLDVLCVILLVCVIIVDLCGIVLVVGEGINLFLVGLEVGIDVFYVVLCEDLCFVDLCVKISYSWMQLFVWFKVKVKLEIISFCIDDGQLLVYLWVLLVDLVMVQCWLCQGYDDVGKFVVMLDICNIQEIVYGIFQDVLVLLIIKFIDLLEVLVLYCEVLCDSIVVSFCIGGICCEKVVLWMCNDGMDNVLQFDGGIFGYFEVVGGEGYDGCCFVFDEWVVLDVDLKLLVDVFVG